MPTWPTLWPSLLDGKSNEKVDTRPQDFRFHENQEKDRAAETIALTPRQKQLLYECEEERMVYKACARQLITLRRTAKMTSWDNGEVSSMSLD